MKAKQSISRKLLVSVLSVYFVLTFAVTCVQLIAEFSNTKSYIAKELRTLESTFSASLTRAIWELNTPQVVSISDGLVAIPMIEGVLVRNDLGEQLTQSGNTDLNVVEVNDTLFNSEGKLIDSSSIALTGTMITGENGLFGYRFPLVFEFSGRSTLVGDVTLFSSRNVVIDRILLSVYFMVGSAFAKTTFLIALFLMAFKKHLTTPLDDLVEQLENLNQQDVADMKLDVDKLSGSELSIIQTSFNSIISQFSESQNKLKQTQKQLLKSNDMLDQQNLMLEQEVSKKTANLSQAMMDLQRQKYQLESNQNSLKQEIETRSHTEEQLLKKTHELENTIETLQMAHSKLVESEKFAALGGLVAGITHDVNTPIGVSVTATSVLNERLKEIDHKLENQTLSANDMKAFLAESKQSAELLTNNLQRASELIASFKQIAVDQTSEADRLININAYLNEIVASLKPELKKGLHTVNIDCPLNLEISIPAGALSQIFTNFIINSVIHGFDGIKNGIIDITVTDNVDQIDIIYHDNGQGISKDQISQLFDPFYTTKRNVGGSGLGTNIAYNLVKQTLHGEITAHSEPEKGLTYNIRFPKVIPS